MEFLFHNSHKIKSVFLSRNQQSHESILSTPFKQMQ